jgi:hypothetical protein
VFLAGLLSRSVTGLTWPRFVRAQVPATLQAAAVGVAGGVVAYWGRAADVGTFPLLIGAGVAAAAMMIMASRLRPELFLGSHGIWAVGQARQLLRRRRRRKAAPGAAGESLAPVGETHAK